MEKVLYIAPNISTFVRNDIILLEDDYTVLINVYDWKTKWLTPINLIRQFFVLLIHIGFVKHIIVSFGGYWSILPSLFGKVFNVPCYVILNGTDAVSFPEINYGSLRSPLLKKVIYFSLKWSKMLLPVSKSLLYTKNEYFQDQYLEFGVKYYFKSLSTPYHIVPNGIDIKLWENNNNVKKEPKTFLTVMGKGQENVKGIELYVKLAYHFSDCNFTIAGVDNISMNFPSNLKCIGRKTHEELNEIYHIHEFYVQVSNYEGFGVSLCEAMLCGCVPIVSNVNVLAEIIGESGFVIEKNDILHATNVVSQAIDCQIKSNLSEKAKQIVIDNYSLEKRKRAFIKIINMY